MQFESFALTENGFQNFSSSDLVKSSLNNTVPSGIVEESIILKSHSTQENGIFSSMSVLKGHDSLFFNGF